MVDATWLVLTAAGMATVAGCAWLALAMDVHWQQVHGSPGPARATRIALRVLGIAGLAASAALCFMADRPSMAVLVWVMLLAGGALSVALTLAWKPEALGVLWSGRW